MNTLTGAFGGQITIGQHLNAFKVKCKSDCVWITDFN